MFFSTQTRQTPGVVGVLNGVSRDCMRKLSIIFQGSSASEGDQPTSGVLTSPNYPKAYPNNLNLVQKIQVPEGNTIWIRFPFFECERKYDTVTITDKDGTRLGFFDSNFNSHDDWRKEIVSNTDTVEVLFHSDESATRRGWRLDWGKYKVSIMYYVAVIHFLSQEWLETKRACRRVEF